ncbi:uncharacterized protein LOC131056154 isoform X4 [Cryptomeria japonica]|uniref:uncharacterized protein LOC131056154 isoform X4 n=1 Tax=Cryptomeria japonica TaxID=3369 RepID=UPI0025ACC670|nr:uncharacterized protein LOC131056154 isoform X4 [Cryptomeria japonica]
MGHRGEEQRGELQWLIGVVAKKKLKLLWPLLVLSCPFADICYHPQPCSVVLSEREKGVPLLEGLTVGRFTQSRDYKSIEKSSSWQGRIESKDKQVAKEQMKVEGLTVGRFTQSRDYKSIEKSSSWQGRIESKGSLSKYTSGQVYYYLSYQFGFGHVKCPLGSWVGFVRVYIYI